MIVTLDTGILVRATPQSNGPARRLVELWSMTRDTRFALSRYILAEVGKALSYSRLYRLLRLTPEDIQAHLDFLAAVVELVDPVPGSPVILTDPKDDPVFYTAVAAGADVLCARDRGFYAPNVVALADRHDLSIMDDLRLLAMLESRH